MVDVGWGREWAEKEVSKGKGLVKRYQELTDRYMKKAGEAAEMRDFALAQRLNLMADNATNTMHYWLGHMNAFIGIVAQLGMQEIVEEELDEEGSCL